MRNLVAGADFGSDSVRIIVIDAMTGERLVKAVCSYPRWQKKLYCDAAKNQFRQHPQDYIESFVQCMNSVMEQLGENRRGELRSIAIDATGSTPCPVDRRGVPLALLEEFADDPDAMFHLWKDHTAVEEAKEINEAFSNAKIDYTMYQGIYSSEWFWSKILRTIRKNERIREKAWMWVEHCDWLPSLLIGKTDPETMYRGSCAAGHKALWNSHFGGLPDRECLESIDPYLALVYDRYGSKPQPAGTCAGVITREWAERLGVPQDTIIGGGSFDAHAGAVGAGVSLRTMVKVVGTSTVDMLIEASENVEGKDLRAYCGQAEDSIVPGYIGIEASQAAFGDVYAWFAGILMWPVRELINKSQLLDSETRERLVNETAASLIRQVEQKAMLINDTDIIALDWFNGRRYPNLNDKLKAAVMNLGLGSTAPEIYHALVMGTVFGSRHVFDKYTASGIKIERIIMVGGIAKKSPFVMQMMSDVLQRPLMVCNEEQTCAFGAAIYAAVAAGFYPDVPTAQRALCEPFEANYYPIAGNLARYEEKYQKYLVLGGFVESVT
ncbi:L-ribulokinase [Anaerobacterium chartisolvens]|uniref:L-ribulokinase n=1 Tax=Anaerobacterium chartisolvens TaxID=1297424 RepID=A0A369B3E0_9FIRM|nr:ribulokinase [Anaerobacterium chartisolvens]RCX16102.1 L-ribulokinase [Anaerobacterium chartisolvens]